MTIEESRQESPDPVDPSSRNWLRPAAIAALLSIAVAAYIVMSDVQEPIEAPAGQLRMPAGKPLLEPILVKMAAQSGHLAINANQDLEEYRRYGFPVFADDPTLEPGPLRGILAALSNINTPWILTVPCDTPRLPDDLALRLFRAANSSQHRLAVPHDGKRLQSLCLLIHRSLYPQLKAFVENGGRAVKEWIGELEHAEVDFHEQAAAFINLNTPSELEKAETESS